MRECRALILAAGKGSRMKSAKPKVLHEINGRPMLAFTIEEAKKAGCNTIIVIVGHGKENVMEMFGQGSATFVIQEQQLGSAHAVLSAKNLFETYTEDVLILAGDVPLITAQTLSMLIEQHRLEKATVSVLTAVLQKPGSYGRIVRDTDGFLNKIVEHADATDEQRALKEINTGIYCCDAGFLFYALEKVGADNMQGEYYLPDIVSVAVNESRKVSAIKTPDISEINGINNRVDLAEAEKTMNKRTLQKHMLNGVTIIDPDSTYIEDSAEISSDTVIYPNTSIRGRSVIGSGTVIDMNVVVEDSIIGNNVHIKPCSVIQESSVMDNVQVGPFAHIRPQTRLEENSRVGNFVEVKKSVIGSGSKANHLTYIGDTTVGKGVNIGAGTITCNYDGVNKHPTVIEDGAFIGSNSSLVAPVKIGNGAVVGAGSTITKDVPRESLAVGRAKQITYDDFKNWTISQKKA